MTEKWWQKIIPKGLPWYEERLQEENADTVNSMRGKWKVLEELSEGVTIYQTPAGIYKVEEKPDGRLVRLEWIEDYKPK